MREDLFLASEKVVRGLVRLQAGLLQIRRLRHDLVVVNLGIVVNLGVKVAPVETSDVEVAVVAVLGTALNFAPIPHSGGFGAPYVITGEAQLVRFVEEDVLLAIFDPPVRPGPLHVAVKDLPWTFSRDRCLQLLRTHGGNQQTGCSLESHT